MLIRYSVENYRSYKDKQIFSMMAGKQTKHKNHIVEVNGRRVLKGSFFFGANAAGKSNLFDSMNFAQSIVLNGIRKNILSNKHFRVDSSCIDKPGVFQFDFFVNEHFYSYGFSISYTKGIIEEEWLYLCDTSDVAIFERSIEDGKTIVSTEYKFSDEKQKQSFSVFAENVPESKTFLLEISERKLIESDDFIAYRDAMQWMSNLIIILPSSTYSDKINLLSETNNDYDLVHILKDFDTGIEDIHLGEESLEDVLDFLPEKVKVELIQDIENTFNEKNSEGKVPQVIKCEIGGRFLSFTKKNNSIFAAQLMMDHGNDKDPFELSDESDGTQRLFDLIPVYRAGKESHVILVDELDRSFHTKLVQKFIQMFYETTNGIYSQLIASVHDSNIMDLDLLRQDEIWFVERQPDHSTSIYSLNKFQARFDKKIQKDYLLGRYGAIPCFAQIDASEVEEE